ncbi:Hypothetical predicted protein [Octopus vulgaris]|uniref:Uncharacterized protein n=1 Tax=Octopus vulgaris TaxID=6645 RepID=A0AA36FJL1_OCTVU|nr:Hypothetical predicted protein [Octopus vulgaris]
MSAEKRKITKLTSSSPGEITFGKLLTGNKGLRFKFDKISSILIISTTLSSSLQPPPPPPSPSSLPPPPPSSH